MPLPIALFSFLLFLHSPAAAWSNSDTEGSISVVGFKVPWLFDDEIRGPYNTVFDHMRQTYAYDIEVDFLPIRRAERRFFNGTPDCYLIGDYQEGVFEDRGLQRSDIIISDPINIVRIRLVTRPGEPVITSLEEVYGRTLVVDLAIGGYDRVSRVHLKEPVAAIDSVDVRQAVNVLLQKRVDIAMVMDYDLALFMQRNPGISKPIFDPGLVIEEVKDAVVCKRNPRSIKFIQHVNEQLAILRASGDLDRLLTTPLTIAAEQNSTSTTP